jgi:type II secretory pathway predicted ATPase ExeA
LQSTLLNGAAHLLGKQFHFFKISDPSLSELDFFKVVANAFGIEKSINTREDFFIYLKQSASDIFANASRVVLIIDEAHRLSVKLLEQIRLISNIKKGGQFLINIVLAGRNEFSELLKANLALSQTIALSYTLQQLTETETAEYIMHRLQVAGSTPAASRKTHRL